MNPTDNEAGLEQDPRLVTGADSLDAKDSASVRRDSDASYAIPTRPPIRPLPPFDQFAIETAPQLSEDNGLHDGEELPDRLREMWDTMEPTERLFWEAQYGRQMLEFTEQSASWKRERPTPQKPRFEFSLKNLDFGQLATLWDEFMQKAAAEVLGFGKPEETTSQIREERDGRGDRDDGLQNQDTDPRGRLQVLHRAEIYRVRETSRYSRSRKPEAKLDRSYEQTTEINVVPASRLLSAPIFEITTMYAAARRKNEDILSNFRRLINEDEAPTSQSVKPGAAIQVRVEAGVLLTIGSEVILEAVRSVAEHYPDLVWEGDELVIPEPFCVLFHYRNEILAHRDLLHRDFKGKQFQYDGGDASAEDRAHIKSTKAKSREREDEFPDQALHIDMLYEYVDNRYVSALCQEDERLRKETPTCTFAWSWRLFKPGELVYIWDDDVLTACVVESHTLKGLWDYDEKTKKPSVKPGRLRKRRNLKFKDELRAIVITLSHMEYDGTYLGRRIRKVTIWPFEGEKDIKSLPAFPARFWDDESVRDRMIKRGKLYCSFTKRTHCQYQGQTMSSPRRTVHSRIMVDSETYYGEYSPESIPRFHLPPEEIGNSSDDSDSSSEVVVRHRIETPYIDTPYTPRSPRSPKSALNVRSYRKKLDSSYHFSRRSDTLSHARIVDPKQSDVLSDELYMLCPRHVNGYILKERKWDLLDVENITPCEFNENIMDDLVLSDEAKRLIQALSSTHVVQNDVISADVRDKGDLRGRWSADFIQNKGDGQIILLHGRPGVGKTSTAECVAEITNRPLISITCGDLGTTATVVEESLNKWLHLGTTWEAVLLFDEADVYLESRQQGDFERNTLVSVFLRALEYYQGLLFLTTNRVGSFDEAILSRVHVVLHFPNFNNTEREQIWETSFRKLNEERKDIVIGVGILEYAYSHQDIRLLSWNGREIRNAFNTMVALAEWDARGGKRLTKDGKIELQRKHLQQVVKMSGLFKQYLLRTRGLDESSLAKVQAIRDDEFDPTKD